MIYLYDSTETDFRYNGKPLPTAYDVTVSNTLNSEYYVMGKYPLDKDKVYKEIVEDRIIKVHTMDGMEPFRIVNVSKYELYVEFEAWPLFYADMRNKLVKPLNLKRVSGQVALNSFKNNLLIDTPFDFYSDIADNHDYHTQDENERENNPKQLYNALDVFKTIVKRWGGELWIRGYDIRVNKRIGTDTEAMLYEKKNITEFVDTTNIEGIVTRLHGKSEWQDERQEGEGEGQKHSIEVTVDSPLINNYSGVVFEKQYTNNDIRTEQELKNWLNLKFTTENIDKPQRTIEVGTNVIDDTKIGFADTLILKYIKHDTDVRIKVVGYEYDGFANELKHVVLGQPKNTSSSTIGNTITDLVNNIVEPVDRKTTIAMSSADGKSTVFHGTANPNTLNLNAKENDPYFRTNGSEKEIWRFTGTLWELIIDTSDTTKNAREIEAVIEQAQADKTALEEEIGNSLLLAKAHAESEDARIRGELESEIGGAIELAEQAKADAVTKANQALADAKAHADAEVQASKEHFDSLIEDVETDVSNAQATADSAVEQIDTAVANAGFTSLDDTLQNMNYITMNAEQNAQQAITDASNAYGLAQTSISEAQTAQANSLTALGKAEDALVGVSNLDVRVDDVEAELELKADNTFMNEDGTLTTLSNAITFNAHRFSSDMSRIESRVESLAGEINLVILRDAIEYSLLVVGNVYPIPNYAPHNDTMRELIDVTPGEKLALSKSLGEDDPWWRINFYDSSLNYVTRFATDNNEHVLTVPNGVTKMWVSYPRGSKPQIVRGTTFVPYRPNMADQMTTDEVVLFRNEYDEFADKTERRLTAVDSSGGRLDVAENLITQTANGLSAKVDLTTFDELTGEVQEIGNKLDVTAEGITNKVWKTDIETAVDDIEIGVRNFVLNSHFHDNPMESGSSEWTAMYGHFSYINDTVLRFANDGTHEATRIEYRPRLGVLEPDTWYTFSMLFQSDRGLDVRNQEGVSLESDTFLQSVGKHTVQSFRFRTNSAGNQVVLRFYQRNPLVVGGITDIDWVKIEKGNKATDWTPAPEDTMSAINHIETEWTQTFDTFSQTVSGIDGRVTTQKQTIDNISSTVYDEHADRISTVEQTASGLQITVADKANQSQVTQLATGISSIVGGLHEKKNLIPYWESGGLILVNGEEYVDGNRIRTPLIKKQGEGRIAYTISEDGSPYTARMISLYYADGRFYESREYVTSFSLTDAVPYVRIVVQGTQNLNRKFQLEVGAVTEFAPYISSVNQAQISMLQDNINLRVKEGDVLSQINIEAERTLIQSKKLVLDAESVVFTGSAFIPSAQIQNLHADKINAGTINTARLNTTEIVAQGLTADVIEAGHILADTATIDKLFATKANIDILTAKTAFINSIKAVEIDAARITSGTINTARLNATEIVAQGLTTNVVKSQHILADTALFDKLFTSDLATDRLSAQTAWITNGMFANASIDGAKIQDATIGSAKIASLDVGKISGNTANFVRANFNSTTSALALSANGITSSGSMYSYSLDSTGVAYYANSNLTGIIRSYIGTEYSGRDRGVAMIARTGYELHLGYRQGATIGGTYTPAIAIDGTTGNIYMDNIHPSVTSSQGVRFTNGSIGDIQGVFIRNNNSIGAGIFFGNNGHVYYRSSAGTWSNLSTS